MLERPVPRNRGNDREREGDRKVAAGTTMPSMATCLPAVALAMDLLAAQSPMRRAVIGEQPNTLPPPLQGTPAIPSEGSRTADATKSVVDNRVGKE